MYEVNIFIVHLIGFAYQWYCICVFSLHLCNSCFISCVFFKAGIYKPDNDKIPIEIKCNHGKVTEVSDVIFSQTILSIYHIVEFDGL